MDRRRLDFKDEKGFSIIEVLVAATILVTGLFGTAIMIDMADAVTVTAKAREQAVSLQREVVEELRSVSYDELTPASAGAAVRTNPSLADASLTDPGWTVRRRGITYSVAVGVCDVDDPRDGTGTHDGALFCAADPGASSAEDCDTLLGVDGSIQGTAAAATAGASVGTCGIDLDLDGTVDNLTEASLGICLLICPGDGTDPVPSDYKRAVVLVRWNRGGGSRYALQATTIPNPGVAAAPSVSSLTTADSVPVLSGTSVTFSASTTASAAAVAWYVDGTAQGTASGAGTGWSFSWPLGSVGGSEPGTGQVLDGSYLIGAKAFDAHGQFATARQLTVTLNRRKPYAVRDLDAGRNGSVIDIEWRANPERDIEGYRVYRQPLLGSPVLVCALTTATSCQDISPPGGAPSYFSVALDRTPGGDLREGDPSASASVAALNTRPTAPTNLQVATVDGAPVLTWSAASDPDLGDSVAYYRVYRDGTDVAARYDRTSTGDELTWTDAQAGGIAHTYRVVAVDQNMAESTFAGPVTG